MRQRIFFLKLLKLTVTQPITHRIDRLAPQHGRRGAQLLGHAAQRVQRGAHIGGGQAVQVARIADANLVDGLAVALAQAPLHLRDEMLETLRGGRDQLQLVFDVAELRLGRQATALEVQRQRTGARRCRCAGGGGSVAAVVRMLFFLPCRGSIVIGFVMLMLRLMMMLAAALRLWLLRNRMRCRGGCGCRRC